MTSSNSASNRLATEKSPYLLQHAHNPVQWYPWGEEAFARAAAEDKPIFLSIGYSTCHWCHVMAHESFEDEEVAALLSAHFIAIKVDREERPDIDAIYMGACQAMTGQGGWPLTVLLTPDKKPFFARTYLPKWGRYGMLGLMELLDAVAQQWRSDRTRLIEGAEQVAKALSAAAAARVQEGEPDRRPVREAYRALEGSFDARFGGFGAAPKFPMPHMLMFLLRCHRLEQAPRALAMAGQTAQHILRGGIFDHVGFGLCRYSTDERWLVPHFEKMLYDNALMLLALLELAQATGEEVYRIYARRILTYLAREMTSPQGCFYSAQDADVDGEEGKYYTFTEEEVLALLGPEEGAWLCQLLGIEQEGSFEGRSIPNLIGGDLLETTSERAEALLERLYRHRAGRMTLPRDDKVLTAWNGLMIAAQARAFRVLGDSGALRAAQRAAAFVEEHLNGPEGLRISHAMGEARGQGLLDDHVFLAFAHLELFEAAQDALHLQRAAELLTQVLDRFADPAGGFFLTPSDGEALIFRPKELHDGALPCGNSVLLYVLAKLSALTGEPRWAEAAQQQLGFLCKVAGRGPAGLTFGLIGLMALLYPAQELVCVVGEPGAGEALRAALAQRYHPNLSLLVKTPQNAALLAEVAPHTTDYHCPEGQPAAYYLCENRSCRAPVFSLEALLEQLEG
ncbi:MAG: thioredoxin domain-containing protein [Clostridiales bacterium]|nr:thioredoxin domain-containing protein [Clostridiales bacterium]